MLWLRPYSVLDDHIDAVIHLAPGICVSQFSWAVRFGILTSLATPALSMVLDFELYVRTVALSKCDKNLDMSRKDEN
jgi:hypothetical protein